MRIGPTGQSDDARTCGPGPSPWRGHLLGIRSSHVKHGTFPDTAQYRDGQCARGTARGCRGSDSPRCTARGADAPTRPVAHHPGAWALNAWRGEFGPALRAAHRRLRHWVTSFVVSRGSEAMGSLTVSEPSGPPCTPQTACACSKSNARPWVRTPPASQAPRNGS